MKKLLLFFTFFILLLIPVGAQIAFADVIYESATLGPTAQPVFGSLPINDQQFLGSRFTISEPIQVTHVGGHLGTLGPSGTIWGAIVQLSGPLPSGTPFDAGEVLAITTFEPGLPTSDVSVPLSVTLEPGNYALVFGDDDLFDSTGNAFMPRNNFDTPEGTGSYIHYNIFTSSWFESTNIENLRFTVNGNPISVIGGKIIPIESTSLLLTGAQSFSWMIPVTLSILGIGIFITSRKSEN